MVARKESERGRKKNVVELKFTNITHTLSCPECIEFFI